MPEETTYTVGQAHRYFAVDFNKAMWRLWEKPSLTEAEISQASTPGPVLKKQFRINFCILARYSAPTNDI